MAFSIIVFGFSVLLLIFHIVFFGRRRKLHDHKRDVIYKYGFVVLASLSASIVFMIFSWMILKSQGKRPLMFETYLIATSPFFVVFLVTLAGLLCAVRGVQFIGFVERISKPRLCLYGAIFGVLISTLSLLIFLCIVMEQFDYGGVELAAELMLNGTESLILLMISVIVFFPPGILSGILHLVLVRLYLKKLRTFYDLPDLVTANTPENLAR